MRRLAKKRVETEKLLSEYVKRISRELPKSTIVLFGSRARGNHLPYSDYDIAVVLEHVDDKIGVIEKLRRLKPRGISVDLVVFSLEELEDPIVREMLREGKVLYDGLGVSERI